MTRPELLAIAQPIDFVASMAQAAHEGRKTRFMLPMDLQPGECEVCGDAERAVLAYPLVFIECPSCKSDYGAGRPKYAVGDIIYVQEPWFRKYAKNHLKEHPELSNEFGYCANNPYYVEGRPDNENEPADTMPPEAARNFIRITEVKPQRPLDAGKSEIAREGLRCRSSRECPDCEFVNCMLWDEWKNTIYSIYPPEQHGANPLCWVYEFEMVEVE